MTLELLTPNYLNVLSLYNESLEEGDTGAALKIALNNLPHKIKEVISIRLEQFFNPDVRKNFPPSIEDYEDNLRLCRDFMPEKVKDLAVDFYKYHIDELSYDDAVDVAAQYIPEKLQETVGTRFKEIMADKDYIEALDLKERFPDMIDYDQSKLAYLAFEDAFYYFKIYSKNQRDSTFNEECKNSSLVLMNYINQEYAINGYIAFEENGVKVFRPLNLEGRVNEVKEKLNRKKAKSS